MRTLTEFEQQSIAEQAAVEQQALQHVKQALRVAMGWKTTADNLERKLSSVRFMAQSLERHLERQMALEEEGGYMQATVEEKPHLVERASALRGDHERFRIMTREIMQRLKEAAAQVQPPVDECCEALAELLARIDLHERTEQALLQESLMSEEGGEGG